MPVGVTLGFGEAQADGFFADPFEFFGYVVVGFEVQVGSGIGCDGMGGLGAAVFSVVFDGFAGFGSGVRVGASVAIGQG